MTIYFIENVSLNYVIIRNKNAQGCIFVKIISQIM